MTCKNGHFIWFNTMTGIGIFFGSLCICGIPLHLKKRKKASPGCWHTFCRGNPYVGAIFSLTSHWESKSQQRPGLTPGVSLALLPPFHPGTMGSTWIPRAAQLCFPAAGGSLLSPRLQSPQPSTGPTDPPPIVFLQVRGPQPHAPAQPRSALSAPQLQPGVPGQAPGL